MKITHVVRGNEYLSSAPKYNLLYKAFGWEIPTYVHVSMIVKPDGHKMAKRNGDPSFEDLVDQGYLIDAIVNYVVLLGWSPGGTQEIYSLEELERSFDISGISKSPAVFDINKLNWMNGEYIKKMPLEDFHEKAKPYYKGVITNPATDLKKISKILQARVDVLTAIPAMIDFIENMPEFSSDLYIHKKMKTTPENSLESLKASVEVLQSLTDWNEQTIHDALSELVVKMGIKNGQMFWPIRTALTGKEVTPGGAMEIADILGKAETLKRIASGIKKLEENK
jgi:glutamyl-tRNA synthetase